MTALFVVAFFLWKMLRTLGDLEGMWGRSKDAAVLVFVLFC